MRIYAFLIILTFATWANGQGLPIDINGTLWSPTTTKALEAAGSKKWITPEKYQAVTLDYSAMFSRLLMAPHENEVLNNGAKPLVMELPNPEGGFSLFEVFYFPIMHPSLQDQYPEIRSYAGQGIDDPNARIFFDMTPKGFHAMVIKGKKGAWFIDPAFDQRTDVYSVYFKKDYVKNKEDRMVCHFDEEEVEIKVPTANAAEFTNNCGIRRQYRLALACTGEYAAFHGGTVPLALAAMNTTMTRVNGIYLTEASIQMNIIANNSNIIYLNAATDPYTNNDGGAMLAQNQTTCDNVIGSANYDIGHVFSTGGGGVAYLASPCNNSLKAGGVTGSGAPTGDPFDVDYVAHEMGHQYNCPHTFSSSLGSCSGNGSAANAYEPGSGTTIMAYAGICSSDNVQPNSDPYFHAGSLARIASFVTGAGHTCDQETSNGNTKPAVAALTNVNFPRSTPFVLNGSATDPNGNPLTYCWEQMNAALVSPPAATNTTGPLFRTLEPVSETYRYFPSYDDVLGGVTDPWEVLPSVGRTLSFRLTARDNQVTGGCTDEKNMDVVISGTAGPFVVTAPNGGESFTQGAATTVTWNVAGTTASPISCANVDILYSTNATDPTTYVVLVANTPNDGTQSVTIPNVNSPLCRIMVRCSSTNGTYFYDISDNDFTIGTSSAFCYSFTSTNVPVTIPATGTPTVTSTLTVPGTSVGFITDVNVKTLTGTHTYISDLTVSLTSPANTTRALFGPVCTSQDNFNLKFNDDATNTYASIPCPPTSGLFYKPKTTLSNFNGQAAPGTWTLTISDSANDDGGSLTAWEIEVCLSDELVLPVELLRFSAAKKAQSVELEWITAQEKNNVGFTIERSTGEYLAFESIGFVPARAIPGTETTYQFTDKNVKPGEVYYYRLRQTDTDGKITYSDVEKVSFGSKIDMSIVPNPANHFVRINMADQEAEIRAEVYQLDGRLMYSGTLTAGQEINTQLWPEGTYIITAATNKAAITKKFVILR